MTLGLIDVDVYVFALPVRYLSIVLLSFTLLYRVERALEVNDILSTGLIDVVVIVVVVVVVVVLVVVAVAVVVGWRGVVGIIIIIVKVVSSVVDGSRMAGARARKNQFSVSTIFFLHSVWYLFFLLLLLSSFLLKEEGSQERVTE